MRLSLLALCAGLSLDKRASAKNEAQDAARDVSAAESLLPSPLWAELNEVLKPFVLVEGFVAQEPEEVKEYVLLARDLYVKTICETGFNAGHSTLLWLLANPNAKVYSFDLGQYPYTIAASKFMAEKFPDRFTFTKGNSVETLPKFIAANPHVRCDVTVVDGGHDLPVATADLLNMQALAASNGRVILDDTPCAVTWCMGPSLAWTSLIEQNRVVPVKSVSMGPYRGFVVGQFALPEGLHAQQASQVAVPMLNSKAVAQVLLALKPASAEEPAYAINLGAGDGIQGMPGTSVAAPDPRLVDPTYSLFSDLEFSGVAIEGNANYLPALEKNLPWSRVEKKIAMVTPPSVAGLLADAPRKPLFFKNDIDGYDCAVDWAVLKDGFRPRAIQVEVNPEIPWPVVFGVGYSEKFSPNLGFAGFYGCSLKLTTTLLHGFGYDLIGVGDTHDAFFLRTDVRESAKLPVADGAAAQAQLLSCCNPHQFGIGAAESWAEAARITDPETLVAELKPAIELACKASQKTSSCEVPYALSTDAADFLAL
jgi:hypothetical protein